jgi:putative aldouronate transport system substrate-binding protein
MKKFVVAFLCVLMAGSVFAGGNQGSTGAGRVAPGPTKKYNTDYPLARPFADKSAASTFTIFNGGIGGLVTTLDYPVNTYTKKVVDDTGVMLNFITASSADASIRLSLLLNSGDYPELIMPSGIDWQGMNHYAEEGIFIPLDEYHVMDYPNIKKAFDAYPGLNDVLRGADGKLYGLPDVNDCIQCIYSAGRTWYYMPWIRDNNRKVPATLDEVTAYLRWIRDNDVNGNGDRNDEIPMVGPLDNMVAYFAKAYLPWTGSGIAVYNGTVTEQYRLDDFRKVLIYLNGLYKEGLIKEDSFTMTGEQLQALSRNPTSIIGILTHAWPHDVIGSSSQRFLETFVMPALTGPDGKTRWASNENPRVTGGSKMYITNKCHDPELAIALYDYMLNWQINNEDYGPQGEGWDYADSGAPNLVGGPALYKFIISRNDQQENHTWNQTNPGFRDITFRQAQQADNGAVAVQWLKTGDPSLLPRIIGDPDYLEIMFNYTPTVPRDEGITIPEQYFLPNTLRPTVADTTRISDINAVLNPYKQQAYAEFITGVRDPNSNAAWNAYLADLDRINSKEMVSIYQKYIK